MVRNDPLPRKITVAGLDGARLCPVLRDQSQQLRLPPSLRHFLAWLIAGIAAAGPLDTAALRTVRRLARRGASTSIL